MTKTAKVVLGFIIVFILILLIGYMNKENYSQCVKKQYRECLHSEFENCELRAIEYCDFHVKGD